MKSRRKIILIEPKAPGFHIFSKFALPRLGVFLLGTLMWRRGWDVEVLVEEAREVDTQNLKSADIVGISTITPTAGRAYSLADTARGMGIPVIMGGPHVTFMPDEALAHADFIVRGEGERALMAFIDAWEGDRDYSRVPNLSYRSRGIVHHNPLQPFIGNLDELPYPDFSLSAGSGNAVAGRTIVPVQTSRGCPYDCSFCSVTGMFGRKYRFRSKENIIEELRRYDSEMNFIFFYDDNFTAHRERTRALLVAMIAEGFAFRWSTQVRADVAGDPELVRLMKRAGCHTVFIGFESVNPESLVAMKKKQTVREMARAARVIQDCGIHIHGMFVNGFDQDSWKSVKETVKFAKKIQLTSMQFLMLTPFPGSDFYNQMEAENRIISRDWSLYDAHHAVFRSKNFSRHALQMAQIYSHTKVYTVFEMLKKIVKRNWVALGLALYARGINRSWRKKNRGYLKNLLSDESAA